MLSASIAGMNVHRWLARKNSCRLQPLLKDIQTIWHHAFMAGRKSECTRANGATCLLDWVSTLRFKTDVLSLKLKCACPRLARKAWVINDAKRVIVQWEPATECPFQQRSFLAAIVRWFSCRILEKPLTIKLQIERCWSSNCHYSMPHLVDRHPCVVLERHLIE